MAMAGLKCHHLAKSTMSMPEHSARRRKSAGLPTCWSINLDLAWVLHKDGRGHIRDGRRQMHESMRGYGGPDQRTGFERLGEQALGYLRSRSVDHWLMFLAGLVIGLIVG
jgi:hypothetical protein